MAHGKKDCQSLHETTVDSHLNSWTYSICFNMFAYLLKYISYLTIQNYYLGFGGHRISSLLLQNTLSKSIFFLVLVPKSASNTSSQCCLVASG